MTVTETIFVTWDASNRELLKRKGVSLSMKNTNRKKTRFGQQVTRAFHRLLRKLGFRKHHFDYKYAAVLLAVYLTWPDLDLDEVAIWAGCELEFVKSILDRMAPGPWTRGDIEKESTHDRWFDRLGTPGLMADVEVAMGLTTCQCGPNGDLMYTRRRPN